MGSNLKRKRDKDKLRTAIILSVPGETEEKYFTDRKVNQRMYSLKIVKINDSNPKKSIKELKQWKMKDSRGRQTNSYDKYWCLLDYDNEDGLDRKKDEGLNNAVSLEKRNRKVFYSNPSFEIWVCWHFENFFHEITRMDALSKAENFVLGYDKGNRFELYKVIMNGELEAISNAKAAEIRHDSNGVRHPSKRNPSSTIYRLLKELN